MKTFFIEARAKLDIDLPEKHIRELPKKVGLATTVQHLHELPKIRKKLESSGIEVTLIKGAHSRHDGQLLGCGFIRLENADVDAFLYIGSGEFHARAFLLAGKPVFVLEPSTRKFFRMGREEMERINKKRKGALLKFYSSDRIGVLISVKPGQSTVQAWLKEIMKLEEKFPQKKFYYIVFDTLDFSELENFTFVQCFLNTACPRLIDDFEKFSRPLINLVDVMGYKR